MALHQNGYRDFSPGVRIFGATASNSAYPYALQSNIQDRTSTRNFTAGQGITTNKAGIPEGYRNSYTWLMPQSPGALAARFTIIGEGDLAGAITGGKNAEAALSGAGDLTGTGALIISMLAALSGSGTVSGATLQAFLNLAAALSGSGTAAGVATALGHALAALSGSGTVVGTTTALGELEASITVTGDLLTTANVADAVLDAVDSVEVGLTMRNALRLIVAATAGEVSGGGTTTITIRNAVADSKNRIVATVDVDGNRSALTVDLSD